MAQLAGDLSWWELAKAFLSVLFVVVLMGLCEKEGGE